MNEATNTLVLAILTVVAALAGGLWLAVETFAGAWLRAHSANMALQVAREYAVTVLKELANTGQLKMLETKLELELDAVCVEVSALLATRGIKLDETAIEKIVHEAIYNFDHEFTSLTNIISTGTANVTSVGTVITPVVPATPSLSVTLESTNVTPTQSSTH